MQKSQVSLLKAQGVPTGLQLGLIRWQSLEKQLLWIRLRVLKCVLSLTVIAMCLEHQGVWEEGVRVLPSHKKWGPWCYSSHFRMP